MECSEPLKYATNVLSIIVVTLASLWFPIMLFYLVLTCRHVKAFYERPHYTFNNNSHQAIWDPALVAAQQLQVI